MTVRPLAVLGVCAALFATDSAAAPRTYTPPAGKGPVVILLSGRSGTASYQAVATRISALGYYTLLLDGNDVDPRLGSGSTLLRETIARATASPHAIPGKVVVIGFSMGGGGALAHAAPMGDLVAAVVAYYPYVEFLPESSLPAFTGRIEVPVLVLAGEDDTYADCCRVKAQKALQAAARGQGKVYELVVYPGADHGFNLRGPSPAGTDSARRTDEVLKRHLQPEAAATP